MLGEERCVGLCCDVQWKDAWGLCPASLGVWSDPEAELLVETGGDIALMGEGHQHIHRAASGVGVNSGDGCVGGQAGGVVPGPRIGDLDFVIQVHEVEQIGGQLGMREDLKYGFPSQHQRMVCGRLRRTGGRRPSLC